MKTRTLLFLSLTGALLVTLMAVPVSARAQEGDAQAILKSMSDYVGSQKTIQLTFDSDIEVITPQLEKIQFTNSGKALISRPDKFVAHRTGGYADVALYYNGKTATVFAKHINSYASFEAPATVDQLLEDLVHGHAIALPGADLLLTDSYTVLSEGILEAKHIGRGVIDDVECEHLAFRNFDTDWQLWVEAGEHPVPRKLVITSKTMNSAPQYTVRIKSWQTGVTSSLKDFTFTPPADAQQIDANALIELDELPHDMPQGGGQQ